MRTLAPTRRALRAWPLLLAIVVVVLHVSPSAAQSGSAQDLTSISIEDLSRVKVFTASRHLEYSEDAPSSVTVITADDIVRYGWRTLADVLRSVRGFYTAYDRDYQYVGVRGFLRPGDYNSRILLMVNGHRLNDKLFDSAQIGTEFPLDLDLVDHIEIVRGPSSSMFGSNAMFGVINVITRRATQRKVLEFSGDTSSYIGRTGELTAGMQADRRSMLIAGSLFRSDGAEDLYYPEFRSEHGGVASGLDGDRYEHGFTDIQLGNFRVQGLFSNRVKQISTAPYGTIFGDARARSLDQRWYADVGYQRSFSAKSDLEVHTYYDSAPSLGVGAFGGNTPDQQVLGYTRNRADWAGVDANLGYALGRHRLTVGGEFDQCIRADQKNYYGDGSLVLVNDHRTPWQVGTYAEVELKLWPRLTVDAGGRLDFFQRYGNAFSPRVAAIFKLDPKTSVKYIYGRAFQIPNAYQSYYVDDVTVGEQNPNLRPEHFQSQELVLERRLEHGVQFTVDGFYDGLTDLIEEAPDPKNGLMQFVNVGRDTGRGLEVELEAKRSSGFAARASYTLSEARDLVQSQRLAASPLHMVKLDASLPVRKPAVAAIEVLYTSAQSTYQETRVSPTLLFNATLSTKPFLGGWRASASAYNLFDRSWYSPAGMSGRQTELLQDGRNLRLKLSYSLPSREGGLHDAQ